MERFLIKTMGCKSNQLEGVLIEENLIKNGFEKAEKIAAADFFILNSCTVTHKSDNEAFQILSRAKKQNPQITTVLTGCIAQVEKENLLKNPSIDIVLGNDEKLNAAKFLNLYSVKEYKETGNREQETEERGIDVLKDRGIASLKSHTSIHPAFHNSKDHSPKKTNGYFVGEIETLDSFHQVLLQDTKKTRASLKIQDGCDHRCSYCIIPFARGKNRSADLDFILEQIKIYKNAGFKEIMLTGIHIGQWGCGSHSAEETVKYRFREVEAGVGLRKQDEQGELNDGDVRVCLANSTGAIEQKEQKNLLNLLQEIEHHTTIERFRLGSLNPLEINNEMLEFLKTSEKFCPHFHLSLQSMCNKTLKSMNRHYSVEQALDLIEKISEIFPLGFIGSDIIAGFVGESEEDFQTTIENLKKSKLTQIHTFPYSVRKGTAAEKFGGHLPQKIKDERAKVIKEISAQKFAEFLRANLNSVQEVLIEKNLDRKTGMFKGLSRNYINVSIKSENSWRTSMPDQLPEGDFNSIRNTIQKVKIESISPDLSGPVVSGSIV